LVVRITIFILLSYFYKQQPDTSETQQFE